MNSKQDDSTVIFEIDSELAVLCKIKGDDLPCICIPRSVRTIAKDCRMPRNPLCHLTRVTFEKQSKLEEIRDYFFLQLGWLKHIEIPASVSVLGIGCFEKCHSLLYVSFESGSRLTIINARAFNNCTNLREIEIPEGVRIIPDNCFEMCRFLSRISLPNITHLGIYAFQNCHRLRDIEIPPTVEVIGASCFEYCCSLRCVHFGKSSVLKRIDDYAFNMCMHLSFIEIPETLESLGRECFGFCGINRIVFPENSRLKSIGRGFISGCKNISEIEIPAKVEELCCECFIHRYTIDSELERITFASGSVLKRIDRNAFRCCTNLKEVVLPPNLDNLESGAFIGLHNVNVTCNSKYIIYKSLFLSSDSLSVRGLFRLTTKLTIPANIEVLSASCFAHSRLARVSFEAGSRLKRIEERAFYKCTRLKQIEIPASVELISDGCFIGCSPLSRFSIEEGSVLKVIGKEAFRGTPLTRIDIPVSVELISDMCFMNCSALREVSLHGDSLKVGEAAFHGCPLSADVLARISRFT